MSTHLQDVQRWILNFRETKPDFDDWYAQHSTLIDDVIKTIVCNYDKKLILYMDTIQGYLVWPSPEISVRFGFRLDAELRTFDVQCFGVEECTDGLFDFQGRKTHAVYIDDDVEIVLGDGDNTDYCPGRYHCTTGPHNNLNSRDRYFLWGTEFDVDFFESITRTPKSLSDYLVLHRLATS